MRHLMICLLLLLATATLLAQAPGGAPDASEGQSILVKTTKNLFALRGGALVKYDLTTLKPLKVFELFGPAPTPPADGADRTAYQKYFAEIQRRNAPALMIVKDEFLIIIIGDGYVKISQEEMKVVGDPLDLAPKNAPADPQGRGMREPVPGYLIAGNTLYLLRAKEMLSISLTENKILLRSDVPKELQPTQATMRPGGGRPGGGGNPGG